MQYLSLIAILSLTACAAVSEKAALPGCYEGPCVRIGETQDLGTIAITPLEVIEDSRCPVEAECIWPGRVLINAQIESRGASAKTRLDIESWKPLAIHGGTLELVEVAPDASVQWPDLAPGDYRFRFRFVPAISEDQATLAA